MSPMVIRRSVWIICGFVFDGPFDRNFITGAGFDHLASKNDNISLAVSHGIHTKFIGNSECGRLACSKFAAACSRSAPFEIFAVHLEKVLELIDRHSGAVV